MTGNIHSSTPPSKSGGRIVRTGVPIGMSPVPQPRRVSQYGERLQLIYDNINNISQIALNPVFCAIYIGYFANVLKESIYLQLMKAS
jgi:hypothetical protein